MPTITTLYPSVSGGGTSLPATSSAAISAAAAAASAAEAAESAAEAAASASYAHVTTAAQMGASGDGTDQTAALQSLLDLGGQLYIGPGSYLISGDGLTGVENTHLLIDEGAVIDFSNVTTTGAPNSPWSNVAWALGFNGSIGSPVSLTANAAADTYSVTVGSTTGFAVGDYIHISSNAIYSTDTNPKYGEFKRISAINTGTGVISFEEPLYLPYNTADSATIRSCAGFLKNIKISGGGKFIGAGGTSRLHGAILFRYCLDCVVEGIEIEKTSYNGIQGYKSYNILVDRCRIQDDESPTPVAVDATYGTSSLRMRDTIVRNYCHAIDAGGDTSVGGIAMDISALGCEAYEMSGTAFNTHPGVGGVVDFSHNKVRLKSGLTSATDGSPGGIRCQGPQFTCVGNDIKNVTGHGIFHQIETGAPVRRGTNIAQNKVRPSATNSTDFPGNVGILVQGQSVTAAGDVSSLEIIGNDVSGFTISVNTYANFMNISNVKFVGNTLDNEAIAGNYALLVRSASGFTANKVTIVGNTMRVASGTTQCMYLLAAASNGINGATIVGNVFENGTYGIRADNVTGMSEVANKFISVTNNYLFNAGVTNFTVDRRDSNEVEVTAATYTVLEQDETIVCNRAGTITLTLPDATKNRGRILEISTIQAQQVDSASSNVIPVTGGAAGTAIVPNTDGAWARLRSNGTNWRIIAKGP